MHTVKNKMLRNGASVIALTLTRCPDLDLARVKVVSQYMHNTYRTTSSVRITWKPAYAIAGPSLVLSAPHFAKIAGYRGATLVPLTSRVRDVVLVSTSRSRDGLET